MEEIIFYRDSEDLPGELDNISGNIYLPLCNALKESRIIKIRYEKYPDEYEWRNVLPEVIFHYLGEWYVAAHCYLRKEARTFRFDRIIEAVATRKKGRSHGIAEEYRKNGIPWKSTTGKRLPVYDWKNVDWEEPPPYHRETDEEKRIRNANIDLLNHAGIGRIDRLRKDLAAGADINWFDGQNTPLTRAAGSGSLQTVKFLLNHGADITKRDGRKATMLFCAAWNEHDKLVRLLVEKYRCSPNDKNCHGWTALTAAARGAYHKILRCLLKHGADVNSVDRQRMNTIMFLLKDHISDSKECLKTIRLLVENGIDIHYRDKAGRNALFYAIEKEEVEILRFLLKTGIDVNTRDNTGKTPLLAAMEAYRMIRLGQQASTMETCKKREKIVSLLCNAGADVNAADQDGVTPLMLSTRKNFDLLWKRGADIHAKDHAGRTVAHYHACDLRHIEMLKKAGLDLFAEDKYGNNVMMASPCERQHLRCFIEKYGFSVNERNKRLTLLHLTANENEDPEAVQYLLERGADITALNYNKRTALEQLLQDEPYAYDSFYPDGDIYNLLTDFSDKNFAYLIRACRALDLKKIKAIPGEILNRYANQTFGLNWQWDTARVLWDAWKETDFSAPDEKQIEDVLDLLAARGANLTADPLEDEENCLLESILLSGRTRWAEKYLKIWLDRGNDLNELIEYYRRLEVWSKHQHPEMMDFLAEQQKKRKHHT